jgi:flavin-dependent dehydrogenase
VECLFRLGVLDDVKAAGAVEVTSARVRMDSMEVEIPFERPGLGISRSCLDQIVAAGIHVRQQSAVTQVDRTGDGFRVKGPGFEAACSILVDAAGKLGRFTRRKPAHEFGIQYTEPRARGTVLDFWFFEDGYGGAVSVEGGRSNHCFLINKDKLPKYLNGQECLVTGPLAYDPLPGDYIAVGDAAGMLDPFCGEGMRHALDTGMLAARIVAKGIRAGAAYEEIRREYELERNGRWARKRVMGARIREALRHRRVFRTGLRLTPVRWLNRIWD